ncbi:MAG: hypothetical protein H7Z21_09515 [Hymenobacter sp.]|nr:hypothetical protein [Hymenobacter sp.]
MLALKRLVTVLVMLYLLLVLLLVLSPGSRDGLLSVTAGTDSTSFYYTLFLIGAALLTLQLVTENLDSVLLRRNVASRYGKLNELKARLYDPQLDQRGTAGTGTGSSVPRTSTTVHPEGYPTPPPASTPTVRPLPTDRDSAPLA